MKKEVDLIITNGTIYTVDSVFSTCEALAVKDGIIVYTGSQKEIEDNYHSANVVDLNGAAMFPGFNDAHAHIRTLGESLQKIDLRDATSFEEIIERLQEKYEEEKPLFLAGEGWDQNLWTVAELPDNNRINTLFPDIPVVLTRIDFHAVLANQKAIDLMGLQPEDPAIPAGEAMLKNGKFTGLFLEGTCEKFSQLLPEPTQKELEKIMLTAQEVCFKYGLTSVSTAGETFETIEFINSMYKNNTLKIRLDVWMGPEPKNLQVFSKPISNGRFRVGTLKLYMDGALGSRGALLSDPYTDKKDTRGIEVISEVDFYSYCKWAYDHGFQVATHAIGDLANHKVLNTYSGILNRSNDLRWRIEHAQIVRDEDLDLFGNYHIIPSIQPTHATSDMLWAHERLGERIKISYRYNDLRKQNGWLPSGTDFPIEEVNPVYTFFSAVYRKNPGFIPENGFQPENSFTREEALRSMTIWAAKSSFEENIKGSIEVGKFADLVVLDTDIMTAEEKDILDAKVLMTFVEGELVYTHR